MSIERKQRYSDKLKGFLWYATNYDWPDALETEDQLLDMLKLGISHAETLPSK